MEVEDVGSGFVDEEEVGSKVVAGLFKVIISNLKAILDLRFEIISKLSN